MNVFKKSLFWLLLFVGGYSCFAQEISIRGGLNLSQFNHKVGDLVVDKEGTKLLPGFNLGPILEIPIKNILSFETGILFTSKGHKLAGDFIGVQDYLFVKNLYYLEIPALLKVTIPIRKVKILALAGTYAGNAIFGNTIAEGVENSVKNRYKYKIQWGNELNEYDRFDYGVKFGIGTKIKRYQIGALYSVGLKDFSNDDTFERRNRVMEFYIQYQFANLKTTKKQD